MNRRTFVQLGMVLLLVSAAASAEASARCCAGKLRAVGPREAQLFRCYAKAAAVGVAVDPTCVAAVGVALGKAFGKVEAAGGCTGAGDAGLVTADLERIVGEIAAALRPTLTASACAARKLKAAARLASAALRAFAHQAPQPADHLNVLDPIVIELSQLMQAVFVGIEAGSACPATGDGVAVAAAVLMGSGAPNAPDGVLLTSLRVCPACGDGVKNQTSETCDGTDAPACPGLCQTDCTCPAAAVCGNGALELGEQCDGSQVNVTFGFACTFESGLANPGCTSDCHCCALGACSAFGFEVSCCPGFVCPQRIGPNQITFCQPACTSAADCAPDQVCPFSDYCRTRTCSTNGDCPAYPQGVCAGGVCCYNIPGIGFACG